jgi:NAD(P)-dependent dehydrogenase (short-subunit alcohol dehydrogenase family)
MEQLTQQQNGYLTGKKVVILGGSSGIGLATAKAVTQEGANVVIVSSNQTRIDKALKELPAGSMGFAVDLTDEQQVQSLFKQLGNFDHLYIPQANHYNWLPSLMQ